MRQRKAKNAEKRAEEASEDRNALQEELADDFVNAHAEIRRLRLMERL